MAAHDTASVLHIVSAHEDRLQRVEGWGVDAQRDVAEIKSILKSQSHEIKNLTVSVDTLATTVKSGNDRLTVLETGEAKEEKKLDRTHKLKLVFFTALTTGALGFIFEFIKNHTQ